VEWLTEHKLPIGSAISSFVDLLNDHAAGFFDAISDSLSWLIEGTILCC